MSQSLLFKLIGSDESASKAVDSFSEHAKGAAKVVAGAWTGLNIADAFNRNLDNDKALSKFAAGMGGMGPASEKAGQVAGELYAEGWGESKGELLDTISAVNSQIGDIGSMAPADIKALTRAAQGFADTSGQDVNEVLRTAGQLIKNGLAKDGKQALDVLAKGFTSGADRSGDMLDTLNEYADPLHQLGFSGAGSVALLNSALNAGAFTADKAGDAINEFAIRSIDGSAGTVQAYQILGLNADEMAQKIAAGGPQAQEAFGQIITALGNVTDPVKRETAGVGLFGSMWEDAGSKMVLAMDPAKLAIEGTEGAADSMATTLQDNAATSIAEWGRKIDGVWDSATKLPGPLGDIAGILFTMGPDALALGSNLANIGTALSPTISKAVSAAMTAVGGMSFGNLIKFAGWIGAVVAAGIWIINNWDWVSKKMAQSNEAMANLTKSGVLPSGTQVKPNWLAPPISFHSASGNVIMPTPGGHMGIVGEGGEPEMILPLSKANEMGFGGGGGRTQVNVYLPPGFVIGTSADVGKAIAKALVDAKRSGQLGGINI